MKAKKYPVIDVQKTGKRIKKLCRHKGVSVKEIQEYMNLACLQTVYNWQAGKTLPSIDNFIVLSRLLNRSIDSILHVEE